jgi:beta-phosphoglucomutase-like phosphatase (HAD superfamily)
LAEVKVHIDPNKLAKTIEGKNWRQFLPSILKDSGVDVSPSFVAERKSSIYLGLISSVSINEPLVMLLKTSRTSVKTALVTTASGKNARAILERHELLGLFDLIVTGDDVSSHKPDPEAYLLAAEQLDVLPRECLAFEDSEIGIASAHSAGVPVVRINFPFK